MVVKFLHKIAEIEVYPVMCQLQSHKEKCMLQPTCSGYRHTRLTTAPDKNKGTKIHGQNYTLCVLLEWDAARTCHCCQYSLLVLLRDLFHKFRALS